ncbi:MAG: LamG domain-containing protein [Kiritimatiellae bacterium]|nr:LamG domain-containing protein [Kiritimatiellia bacterium]
MKMHKFLKTMALAAGLGASSIATAGDIYEIRPCDQDGNTTAAWASADSPLTSGETVYFNVRLIRRTVTGTPWKLKHVGASDETLDDLDEASRLKIGIFVSGQLRYATLVTATPDSTTGFTDLVFKYQTRVGDFAMPIVLATGTATAPSPASSSDGSIAYLLGNTAKWDIQNDDGNSANFTFWSQAWPQTPPETDGLRVQDFSLAQAGLYVKTVDFDSSRVSDTIWRQVHQNSSITVGGTPSLAVTGASEDAITLHVWSLDENAVKIKGGTTRTITTGYDTSGNPVTQDVVMGDVVIAGGATSADFAIEGVTEGETCNLVLSPYTDFHYTNGSNERIVDYVTAQVECIEPMPPTAIVEFDRNIAYADTNYTTYAAVMSVSLSEACTEDVTVTLTPSFADGDTSIEWSDYVRFSQTEDSVASVAVLGTDIPTVTFAAGETGPVTFYVYALRSDAHTTGTSSIIVTPTASSTQITDTTADALDVQSVVPVITTPAEGSTISGICGDALDFQVAVEDSYANVTDTATGYQIWIKYRASDKFVQLDGVYSVGENNYLYKLTDDGAGGYNTSTELPQITYPASGDALASQVYVVNPVNGRKSAVVNFTGDISEARTSEVVETSGTDVFYEGEQAQFQISISEANDTGNTIYAFLKASDNVTASMLSGTPLYVICDDTDLTKTKGLAINKYQSATTASKIKFLDGLSEDSGGLSITFEVLLCSSQTYDESKKLTGYDSNYLNVTVFNKEPTITRIEMGGFESENDGYTFPNKVPKGMTQTFTGIVNDAGKYDKTTTETDELFECKWTATLSGVGAVKTETIKGNPDDNPFSYDFPRSGAWTVKLQVKDKDMDDWSATTYSVNINVLDNPTIEVTVPDAVAENDLTQPVTLQASYWDTMYTGTLRVKVTVSEFSPGRNNPGTLKLDQTKVDAGDENVYYVDISDALPVEIAFEELDGTDVSSIYGFNITAEVVTTDVLPTSNTAANEYYLSDTARVLVNNVEPVCAVNPQENTNRWTVAGGVATGHPIRWTVKSDVDADFAGITGYEGIKVSITGPNNAFEKYVTEATTETFYPDFGENQGDYDVTLTIEDKDGGIQTWTWLYTVTPSKFLNTVSTGPSGDVGGSGSNRYAGNGRGAGHVFVSQGGTFSSAENFRLSWNCGNSAQAWLYGFGYKTANPFDNGWLDDERDQAITTAGAGATKAAAAGTTAGYYQYDDGDDDRDIDSFLYSWFFTTPTADATATEWNQTIMIERPGQGVDQQLVNLPSEATEDENYIPVTAVGVFSKEFRPADNLGDINQDGIPDFFAHHAFGGGVLIDLAAGDETGENRLQNDMTNLGGQNPANDLLPAVYNNPLSASYAPLGTPFNVYLQLRGFGDGLNATDVTTAEVDFSDDEQAAWAAYAAAQGLDVANPDLAVWSPEPSGTFARMDPTLLDTDGDGFYDAWEYYFWYMAKVWVPAGSDFARPRAGQNNVFERFNTDNILVGTAISNDDVLNHFNPCTALIGGADFDNDGLSDMEEFVLGTNPCHWDTDGDRICDGWEVMMSLDPLYGGNRADNMDGDFMAFFNLAHTFVIVGENGTEDATAENIEEGTVIYVPEFQDGDIDNGVVTDAGDGQVRRCWRFTPKFTGAEDNRSRLVYGIRNTQLPADGDTWNIVTTTYPDVDDQGVATTTAAWGLYMVDEVASKTVKGEPLTITLQAGQIVTEGLEYVLIHDQVRDAFGFDPRTGWFMDADGYVNARWNPANNGDIETGLAVNTRPYTDWDEYLLMQYRLNYRINYNPESGLDGAAANTWLLFANKTTMPTVVEAAAAEEEEAAEDEEGEEDDEEDTTTAIQDVAAALDAALAESGSTKTTRKGHGADTDSDGVPDGWELYMFRNPNVAPNVQEELDGNDLDGDALGFDVEYAGTDSCGAYEECESIYNNHPAVGDNIRWLNKFFPTNPGTISENLVDEETGTVTRTTYAGAGNDDGADTDGDGIIDSRERDSWTEAFYNDGNVIPNVTFSFIYGTPEDDGTCCIRGGGMNPCTIDTDLDGLPDGWEMQHAGRETTVQVAAAAADAAANNDDVGNATRIADGLGVQEAEDEEEGEGEEEEGGDATTVTYLAGGMDATWAGDAYTDLRAGGASSDAVLGTVRDVDFDHDGLQNYQEYLIQAVRHFRYDDITTPLMGRMLSEAAYEAGADRALMLDVTHSQTFYGYVPFDPADPAALVANVNATWGEEAAAAALEAHATHLADQAAKVDGTEDAPVVTWQTAWDAAGWRDLGYFAEPIHAWDRAVSSQLLQNPVYMLPLRGRMAFDDASHTATGYITTDPRMADTDGDGMDDYWELFHGLDPIMGGEPGAAVVTTTEWSDGKKGDILAAVYDRWNMFNGQGASLNIFNGYMNEWVWPNYSGNGRLGLQDADIPDPIEAPQCYDPVLYPWIMGLGVADADGDGIRNEEERIIANVTDPMPLHTDPTPLWMTERTAAASYVRQYYGMSEGTSAMPWFPQPDGTYDSVSVIGQSTDFMFTFAESEGYDTDNDWTPDNREATTTATLATDPMRFDDPDRRQALWLSGTNSCAMSFNLQSRPGLQGNNDFLKQFTLECWVMPGEKGRAQTILERSVIVPGDSILKDAAAIRANFRLGLTADGIVYGMFDNSDSKASGLDQPTSCQRVDGLELAVDDWSHVALTFDGEALAIYVNGEKVTSATTQLIPANGVTAISQNFSGTNSFPVLSYEAQPAAFFIGARPGVLSSRAEMEMALSPLSQIEEVEDEAGEITQEHRESFDRLTEFYKGWVDEVRVWDGARTEAEIYADYRKRYSQEDVLAQREEVYALWKPVYNTETGDNLGQILQAGATRNANDGLRNLPPELVLHYNFQAIPGAVEAKDVAAVPPGFAANVLSAAQCDYSSNEQISTEGLYPNLLELKGADFGGVAGGTYEGREMPDGLTVGWWWSTDLKNTVYNDYHVVPWIKNTVGHLPVMDGSCVDTFLYGRLISGAYTRAEELGLEEYVFPNTAVPYSSVVYNFDRYQRLRQAIRAREAYGYFTWQDQVDRYNFHLRSKFTGTSDLLPLGDAYAKTCTLLWDNSASDAWEFTGVDSDGDGLPDWWEEYARTNYSLNLDPSESINWDTQVEYRGTKMSASQAYLIDLALGMQPDGKVNSDYAQMSDSNGNGIPDWWEKLFGVTDTAAFADSDGDGLSDFAEYLLSFVFETGKLFDPLNPRSIGAYELDYFFRLGNVYVGEIFTDHDMMEDAWETKYDPEEYVNPYRWDASSDKDEDGWSAFAECRHNSFTASIMADQKTHMLGGQEIKDFPIPTLKLTLRYNLSQSTAGGGGDGDGGDDEEGDNTGDNQVANTMAPVVVRTYTTSPLREELVVPDATFTVAPGEDVARSFYIGAFRDGLVRGTLSPGYVTGGSLVMSMTSAGQEPLYNWYCQSCGQHIRGTYTEWVADRIKHGVVNVGEPEEQEVWTTILAGEEVADGVTAPNLEVKMTSDSLVAGIWVSSSDMGSKQIGTLDTQTGAFTLDLGCLNDLTVTVQDEDGVPIQSRLYTDETLESALFRLGYTSHVPALQANKLNLYLGEANNGYLKEGENRIVAFIDLNGSGAYDPGEPLGYADGVDVGWHEGAVEMELTDTTPIITRAALTTMGGGEEGGDNTASTDRWNLYGNEDGDERDLISGELSGGTYQRFRVVRTLVNGMSITDLGVQNTVVVDRWLNLGQRSFFFEGDVLGDGEYDLDWSTFARQVAGVLPAADITSVTYRVVLGNGTIEAGTTNNLFSVATVRHFDTSANRTVPVALTPGGDESIVFGSRPVFKWTTGSANTYTAFRLQILKGSTAVWDSGVRLAPARNGDGSYTFSPNVYAGDQLEKGQKYTWRVSMFNAKFQTLKWSNEPAFYVGTVDSGAIYGSIDVCARYYGPSLADGVIRVEAFDTPDFSGDPVTRSTVTNTADVAAFEKKHTANVKLSGLKAGTYYVRAYLDSRSEGTEYVKDDWEAWGYACPRALAPETMFSPSAVTVSPSAARGDVATVYIEDVDTNANNVPDAWEIAKNGGSLDSGASRIDTALSGDISVSSALVSLVERSDSTGVPAGLAAQVMSTLSTTSFAAMALGAEIVEGTVAITGVSLDAESRTVTLSVSADVVNTAASSPLYTFTTSGVLNVNCVILRKGTLAEAGWTEVASVPVTIGSGSADITAQLGDDVDLSSGFFKVVIEK